MPATEEAIALTINGESRKLRVAVWHTLLDVLREEVGLTGTKECCAEGECGACTVIVDGAAINSCLMLAVEADGRNVTSVEGLGSGHRLSRVQDAFLATGGVQCGFCIPGMVMAAHALLDRQPDPDIDDVREGLSGNLCRCGGYQQICQAVLAAARGTGKDERGG